MTREWIKRMEGYEGKKVTKEDAVFVGNLFSAWLEGQGRVLSNPVILQAVPGFGKSLALEVFLRYMVRKEKAFGAIVVKERIADLESLTAAINGGEPGIFKQNYAYFIRGYDPNTMSKEWHSEQVNTQANFPVVVMTHKQLKLQTEKNNLRAFNYFIDEDGIKRERRLLIIDERPEFVTNYHIDVRELRLLPQDLKELTFKVEVNRRYVKEINRLVTDLEQEMNEAEENGRKRIKPVKTNFKLPYQLREDLSRNWDYDLLNTLKTFEMAIRNGGFFKVEGGRGIVSVTRYISYPFDKYSSFILDGTGGKDYQYINPDYSYSVMKPSNKPIYSNVNFNLCSQFSLSKNRISNTSDFFDRATEMVKEILKESEGKTLLTTYKDGKDDGVNYFSEMAKRLEDEIEAGKIALKHFDGGRATNEYSDCNNVIFLGVLFKGDSYYPTVTQALLADKEVSPESLVTRNGFKFLDENVEEYRRQEQALELEQEIHRLRAAKKETPVNVYLFHLDRFLLKRVSKAFPGARVKEYEPTVNLTGKTNKTDEVIKFFKEMKPGETFKGVEIQKRLEMHRNTFRGIVESERVKEVMKKYGIIRKKTKIFKK